MITHSPWTAHSLFFPQNHLDQEEGGDYLALRFHILTPRASGTSVSNGEFFECFHQITEGSPRKEGGAEVSIAKAC